VTLRAVYELGYAFIINALANVPSRIVALRFSKVVSVSLKARVVRLRGATSTSMVTGAASATAAVYEY
jgi:hypothetical protein